MSEEQVTQQFWFGALAPSISEQVSGISSEDARLLDKLAKAITLLSVHSIATETETSKMRRKIVKRIERSLQPTKPKEKGGG